MHIDHEATIRQALEAKQLDVAARKALDAYGSEILSFLAARLGNVPDGREVFSMFAEDMWTGLPSFEWRCSARTWLYTLARNAAHRYQAAPQNRGAGNVPMSQVAEISAAVERVRSATQLYQQTSIKDRFKQLRGQLPEEDQMLLILRVDRGLSFRELAVAMSGDANLDEAAITKEAARLRKAFERLKLELRELADRAGLLPHDE